MIPEDRGRVLHGKVELDGRWVPIARKLSYEKKRVEKIKDGYVEFLGEWISIEEKQERVVRYQESDAPTRPMRMRGTDTSTVVNVHNDNRSYHEHRHVHVKDEESGGGLSSLIDEVNKEIQLTHDDIEIADDDDKGVD
jgi:hypothetical protein